MNKLTGRCKRSQRGFSIIELGIMIVVAGMFIVGLMKGLERFERDQEIAQLEETMEVVQTALQDYIFDDPNDPNDPERLAFPCPADPVLPPSDTNFGQEALHPAQDSCHPAILDGGGPLDDRVAIGAVPTKALGIANKYMLDPWGNRLTYAVSNALTYASAMTSNAPGRIVIEDETGNVVRSDAQFILVSHGPDGAGAYTASGGVNATPCAGPSAENCNDDPVFLERRRSTMAGNMFDDTTSYSLVNEKDDNWWVASRDGQHIYTRNPGNLGVGTAGAPRGRVHVNEGDVKLVSGAGFLQSGNAMVDSGDIILRDASVVIGRDYIGDVLCEPDERGTVRYNTERVNTIGTDLPPEHEFCDGECWQPLSGVREEGQSRIVNCPPPMIGYVLEYRSRTCPAEPWPDNWTAVDSTCAEVCLEETETRTENCPTGYSGSGNVFFRSKSCPDPTDPDGVWSNWTQDIAASDCTEDCAATEQRQISCTSPETGLVTQERTHPADCSANWSAWSEVSNTCTAGGCIDELVSWGSDASCQGTTGAAAHATVVTLGGGGNTADYECYAGSWRRLGSTCITGDSCTSWSSEIFDVACNGGSSVYQQECVEQTSTGIQSCTDPSAQTKAACMTACQATDASCCHYVDYTQVESETREYQECVGTDTRSAVSSAGQLSGNITSESWSMHLCLDCPLGGSSVNVGTVTTANIASSCSAACGPTDECCVGAEDTGGGPLLPFNRDCPDTTPPDCADTFTFTDLVDVSAGSSCTWSGWSGGITPTIYGTLHTIAAAYFDTSCGALDPAPCQGCTSFPFQSFCTPGDACAGTSEDTCLINQRDCDASSGTATVWDRYECTCSSGGTVTSDIVQITGLTSASNIAVSGGGSPEYRICSDATCTTVVAGWSGAQRTISNNQYVQLRMTAPATEDTVTNVTLSIGSCASDTWSVRTAGSAPYDAVCGDAHGLSFTNPPGSNLCEDSSRPPVTDTGTNYEWTCLGANGGADADCAADKRINGACGPAHNNDYFASEVGSLTATDLCDSGTASATTINSTTITWTCDPAGGGTGTGCSALRNINAICGGAGTTNYYPPGPPAAGLCAWPGGEPAPLPANPTPSVNELATTWSWTCQGTNNGANQPCSTGKNIDAQCNPVTDGQSLTSQPTANLCMDGMLPPVTDAGTEYEWTCPGTNDGAVDNCSATKASSTAECGSTVNGVNMTTEPLAADRCDVGTQTGYTNNSLAAAPPYSFDWVCDIADPGADVNCSAGHRINGACGPAHETITTTAPSGRANLCNFDDENLAEPVVTEYSDSFTWTCRGVNTGINENCQASKGVMVGCFVDGPDLDSTTQNSCSNSWRCGEDSDPQAWYWDVGDYWYTDSIGATVLQWNDPTQYEVEFSGDCNDGPAVGLERCWLDGTGTGPGTGLGGIKNTRIIVRDAGTGTVVLDQTVEARWMDACN